MTTFAPTDFAPTEHDAKPALDHLADYTARLVTNAEMRQLMRNADTFTDPTTGVRYRWTDEHEAVMEPTR